MRVTNHPGDETHRSQLAFGPNAGRRRVSPVVVLATAMLLAVSSGIGCGAGDPQSFSATNRPTTGVSSASASPAATTVASYRHRPRHVHYDAGFDSPTGNIHCAVFQGDPQRLGCKTLNNGRGAILETTGPAYEDGDQTAPRNRTLPYGWHWTTPYFLCWSKFTEVLCRSKYSRQGFSINRAGIQYWVWPHAPKYFEPSDGGGGGTIPGVTIPGGTGSLVQCRDGTWSHSGGIQGACSWHGGVA
jgi:hypothetical protein